MILSDITGRQIALKDLPKSSEDTFDITELPAGVYIVRAFSGGNSLFTEKVVIVK